MLNIDIEFNQTYICRVHTSLVEDAFGVEPYKIEKT